MMTIGTAALLATLAGASVGRAQCTSQKLTADTPQPFEYFGGSLAMSQASGSPVLILGAPYDDTPIAQNSGSFYVFTRVGNVWGQANHLYPGDLSTDANFGTSVSYADPYLIVGAPNIDTNNGTDIGAFYVYERSGSTWANKGRQTPVWSQGTAHSGAAVAITADNGGWALVGAPEQDWTAPNPGSGAAYFYERLPDGSWGYIQGVWDYNASGSGANQHLGSAVAIKGNVAVIGAAAGKATPGSPNYSGYVKIFRINSQGTQWAISGPDRFAPAGLQGLDYFGQAVATDGTYVAISATGAGSTAAETPDTGALSSVGCVYVYRWNGSAWVDDGKIFPQDGAIFEYMGGTLAIDNGKIYAGSYASRKVRVFRRLGANHWVQEAVIGAPAGATDQGFGAEVAVSNGSIAISNPYENSATNQLQAGSAYVFSDQSQGNDSCDGATVVQSGNYTGCTTIASRDGHSSCGEGGANGPGADVWYSWTPTCSGNVIIDTIGSNYDTVLSVHSGCPVPGGATNTITCNDDAGGAYGTRSIVTFDYTAGTRYLIRVAGYNGHTGDYTLRINEYQTPGNNACSSPAKATVGAATFKTCRSTTDGPTNATGCTNVGHLANDVWFKYRAISGGQTTMTTFGSNFDTIMEVFPGLSCPSNNAQAIGCNDDASIFNRQSSVTINTVAGQDYLVRVGGYDGATGDGVLNVLPACPCDYNGVNGTDLLDIFDFLQAWFAGNNSADFNGQNGVEILDIFGFLTCWFGGCA
jgi:hypothetical protein